MTLLFIEMHFHYDFIAETRAKQLLLIRP